MLYELFDAALRSAGIGARRRGRFTDRGDGLLEQPSDRQVRASFSPATTRTSRILMGGTASSGSALSFTLGTSTTTTTDTSAKH